MILSLEESVRRLSEHVADNTTNIKQKDRQRRNQPVDIYGAEFYRQGAGNSPASFYVSISPDMVYLERFEFKLIIQPFVSTVKTSGVESVAVQIDDTSLEIDGTDIKPNPHKHESLPHTHNIVNEGGIVETHTTAKDFRIAIEGEDITPYLMAQYGGDWIDGEGVYPSLDIEEEYDILEVTSDLKAEGKHDIAEKLLEPGYKLVQVSSTAPFACVLVLYLKYSHLNR